MSPLPLLAAAATAAALAHPAAAQCPVTPLPVEVEALDGQGNPNPIGADVGRDVAVAGDRIAVSSTGDALFRFQSPDPFRGAVWILEPDPADPGAWHVATKLRGGFSNDGIGFGWRVVLPDPDTLVVSAPGLCVFDCIDTGPSGLVFVYERGPGGWTRVQTLSAPVPGVNDLFGAALAADGDLLAVGSAFDGFSFPEGGIGAVHVYERTPGGYEHRARVESPAPGVGHNFGRQLDLAAGLLAVTEPATPVSTGFEGAAHVFRMGASASEWAHLASFGPEAHETPFARYGHAVATDGSTVVVGAPGADLSVDPLAIFADEPGAVRSGRVEVLEDTGSGWARTARLAAPTPQLIAELGARIVVDGDRLVVGSPRANRGPAGTGTDFGSGVAVVFERRGARWAPVDVIAPDSLDGASAVEVGDRFADALALDGDRLVLGAREATLGEELDRGAAVLFDLGGAPCDGRRLLGAPGLLSLALGGEHVLGTKAAGIADGGIYVVVGSLSGTDPGLDVGSVHVPLNPDAYLGLTIQLPNQPPLAATLGLVDPEGEATSAFVVPPGTSDPALVGLELHHATMLFAPPAFELVHATDPARLALVP